MPAINAECQKQLFTSARTQNGWRIEPAPEKKLRELYDLMKWGPTSSNCCPLRVTFLISQAAKERLKPALAPGNVEKTMTAPVVAILARDLKFYEQLPFLSPKNNAVSWFQGEEKKGLVRETAVRNATLQGGYFIIAARAVGLDCAPMSGFDAAKVDAEFFPDGQLEADFICALGIGDPAKVYPRGPRLDFDQACKVL